MANIHDNRGYRGGRHYGGKPSGGFGRDGGRFGGGQGGGSNLREKFMHRARKKFEEFRAREDLFLMEVDRAIDDLDKMINLIGERLEEWMAFYISGIRLGEKAKLAKLTILIADKKDITKEDLNAFLSEKETEAVFEKLGQRTKEVKEKDLIYMKKYAEMLLKMVELNEFYANEIDALANRIAPNATYLVGGKVVAKMITLAKGLDRLAKMPSSTVQLLGAEKALFNYLKMGKKGDPPKHGVILFSPQVSGVRKEYRGRMARTLAAKLSIAFRVDDAKGEFYGKQLKEAIDRRMKELI
jgi:nucleolar protein 56